MNKLDGNEKTNWMPRWIIFSFRGFLQGAIFSLSMGLFMVYTVKTVILSKFASDIASNTATLILASVFTVFFLIFLIAGLRGENHPTEGIRQNHRGLLKVFGARTKEEVSEGLYWWWPIIGSVYVQDMRINTLLVPFDIISEPLALLGGSYIKSTTIAIPYHPVEGRLYDITDIEQPMSEFLKEISSDRIRNGANLVIKGMSEEDLKNKYKNLSPLALLNSPTKWKDLILYGGTYPSDAKLLLEKDLQMAGQSVLSPDERRRIIDLDFSEEGIIEIAYRHGIAVTSVAVSSFVLPDNIQALIYEGFAQNFQERRLLADDVISENHTLH